MLEQAGIAVNKFGGEAFRAAVSDGQVELTKLLLEKGAIINYHKLDMVFPYASTPVTEAARHNGFSIVRWLMEQRADITIADKYGDRPYTVAVQNKNQELADYLKALEPEEWHNEQEMLWQLIPYQTGGILEDRPLASGISRAGAGEMGGAVPLHRCAGDDLETEKAALPHGENGQLQRLFAVVEFQRYEAFHKFDNQCIEKSLVSEKPLVRIFALMDRRLGKRRLLALV